MTNPTRPPAGLPAAPRLQRGFTLLEVLVAVSIMAAIMTGMYMSVDATLRTQDMLDYEIQVVKQGPRILSLVERDLRQAYLLDIEDNVVFRGESRTMLGESADSLTMLSSVDSTYTHLVEEREVPSDISETGYRLRIHPEIPDLLQLWRRQGFFVDEKPFEDGAYELVYDRVISFQLRYFENWLDDAEELREWDSIERQSLPAVVKLRLEIEVGERGIGQTRNEAGVGLQTLLFERQIPLARGSELSLRAHALTPTFAEAAAAGAGGGGDEGGGPGGGFGAPGGPGGPGGEGGGQPGDPNTGDELGDELSGGDGQGTDNPFGGDGTDGGDGGGDNTDVDLDDLFGGLGGGGGGGGGGLFGGG